MQRKTIRYFLLLVGLIISLHTSAAVEVDGIYYSINSSTKKAEVTYKDANYNSYSSEVVIPDKFTYVGVEYSVTSIGDFAFSKCSSLTSVTIPNSVTKIGLAAFWDCTGLTSVTIPNSVTSIGESAFFNCSGLTSVTIPNSVTSIGESTFLNCRGLTSVTIPNSVTSIGGSAFDGCRGLTSLTIPNSVTSIGESAFYDCINLKSVVSKIEIPFTIDNTVFDAYTEYYGQLKVPKGKKSVYQSTNGWKEFSNIVEGISSSYTLTIQSSSGGYVSYNGANISATTKTFTIDEGSSVTLTITPNSGYKLSSLTVNGTNVTSNVMENQYTLSNISANTTVVATFEQMIYTLSIQSGVGGTLSYKGISISGSISYFPVEEGLSATISISPNTGYKLHKLTVNGVDVTSKVSNSQYTISNITANTTVVATFEQSLVTTYSLSIQSGAEGSVSYDGTTVTNTAKSFTVNEGTSATITITPNTGYKLSKLTVNGTNVTSSVKDNKYTINSISTNTTVVVTFEQITYTLSVQATGNGSVTYNNTATKNTTKTFTVNHGSSATLTISADSGYRLASLKVNGTNVTSSVSNNQYTINNITANTTVVATFEQIPITTYSLSIQSGAGGSVSYGETTITNKTQQFTVEEGTSATITITPNTGYKLSKLMVNETDVTSSVKDNKYTISSISGNTTVVATFEQITYTLSVQATGNGTVTYNNTATKNKTNTFTVNHGTSVTLSIAPDSGYKLSKLTVNGTDVTSSVKDNKYTISSVSGNTTVVATFEQITYTLSVQATGNGTVTYNNTATKNKTNTFTVNHGTSVTFSISPDSGYRFASLKVNGTNVTSSVSNNQYSISNITANTTVVATFEQIPITTYSLSIQSGAGGSVSYDGTTITNKTQSFTVNEGTSATITISPNTGYKLSKLTVNGTNVTSSVKDNKYTISSISGNTTVVATFEQITYTLSVQATGNGNVTYNNTATKNKTNTFTVNHGTSVTLSISPDSGYRLASLKVNGTNVTSSVLNNQYTISNITGNITVVATFEQIATGIEVNATNFPDEAFRNWMLNNVAGASDGILTDEEIAKVKSINCSGTSSSKGNISNLKGIEFFTALTHLSCSYNQLTTLDVSNNTALTELSCSSNQLTTLDISKNTALTSLYCSSNQLSSLDVTKNTGLTVLCCESNQLTSLDVRQCRKLITLSCNYNQLTNIDLSTIYKFGKPYIGPQNPSLKASDITTGIAIPIPSDFNFSKVSNLKLDDTIVSGSTTTFDGQKYLVFAQPNTPQTSIDGKKLTYYYDTDNNWDDEPLLLYVSITLSYNPTTYSLSIQSGTGGSVSYDGTTVTNKTQSFTVNEGTSATITITPNTGYRLGRLTVNGTNVTSSVSNNKYTISSITSNTTVVATFVVKETPGDPMKVGTAVDLGLSSGILWADINVGAQTSEDCGNYYAWGETETKDSYSFDNYLYKVDGATDMNVQESYIEIGSDIKGTAYDVAHVKWGGKWRMPTENEMWELINNCTWIWKDNGFLITGPNGNSIFLPAAGYMYGSSAYGDAKQARYWTSDVNVYKDSYHAWARALSFVKSSGEHFMGSYVRSLGCAIRPVYDKTISGSTYYTLSIQSGSGGSVSFNSTTISNTTKSFTVSEGRNVTITITPNDGYQLASLTVNGANVTSSVSNNQYTISNITANTTVVATFEQIPISTYTLSIQSSSGGSVTYNGTTISYSARSFTVNQGVSATITLSPNSGYRLASLTVNGTNVTSAVSNNQYTISNISDNTTVVATFEHTTTDQFPVPKYVDMGTSVRWAEWNMGAQEAADFGLYFGWGDVAGDMTSTNPYDYAKGFNAADKTIAGNAKYDVAALRWGGKWRMPTEAELLELAENSTWTRETRTSATGESITGYLVTSKISGNSIFLPAGGYYEGTQSDRVNSYALYWSADFDTSESLPIYYRMNASPIRKTNVKYMRILIRPVYVLTTDPDTPEVKPSVGTAVDLGLSVKWANYNVGATSETDPGYYIQWGETGPREDDDYSKASYIYYNASTSSYIDIGREFNADDDYSKDAARQQWGGTWRVPTEAEMSELWLECTWTWTTKNGMDGFEIKSKKNNNKIFLPAGGWKSGSKGNLNSEGTYGMYWTSSVNLRNTDYGLNLLISSALSQDDVTANPMPGNYREFGMNIRAVCDEGTTYNSYSLSIQSNSGGSVSYNGTTITNKTQSFTVKEGTSVTITITPNTGYRLGRLTVNGTNVTSSVSNNRYTINSISGNTTVVATFEQIPITTYSLSIQSGAGGSVSYDGTTVTNKTQSFTVNEGTSATITITPNSGYRLNRLTVNGTNVTSNVKDNQYTISSISGNTTVVATFEQIPATNYTLSIQSRSGGSVTYNGTTVKNATQTFTVNAGVSATITITPDSGYRLASLTVNGTNVTSNVKDNQYTIDNITTNTTVVATFEDTPVTTFSLSIQSGSGGSVSYNGTAVTNTTWSFTVNEGTSATITISPNTGYKLSKLTVNGTNVTSNVKNNQYTISRISGNTTVVATFEQITYTLSVQASGNGTVTFNSTATKNKTNTFTVNHGSSAMLNISPDSGYRLAALTVNGANVTSSVSNNQYIIRNITANTTVVATFEQIPATTYSLSIQSGSGGSVTYNGTTITNKTLSFTIAEGSSATITITPNTGYKLDKVTVNGTDVTESVKDNQYTISSITGNTTVSVTFKSVPQTISVDGINYEVKSAKDYTLNVGHGDYSGHVIVPAAINYDGDTWTVAGVVDGAFNLSAITAITWNPNAAIADGAFGTLTNPNLLLYVKAEAYAPSNVQNVIANGRAKKIILTEAASGNDFYCPEAFTAEVISYTHKYGMTTGINECRGWETIALPFTVQKVTHQTKGQLVTFKQWDQGTSAKPYWLYKLTYTGFVEADFIEANTPYVISMPNNDTYYADYILAGTVTFSAENATVKSSENLVTTSCNDKTFKPCFAKSSQNGIYAINAVNDWTTAVGGFKEGSVFVENLRPVMPFEAYMTTSAANAKGFIPIFETLPTAIREIPIQEFNGMKGIRIYSLSGELIMYNEHITINEALKRLKRGVYFVNGKKMVIRKEAF